MASRPWIELVLPNGENRRSLAFTVNAIVSHANQVGQSKAHPFSDAAVDLRGHKIGCRTRAAPCGSWGLLGAALQPRKCWRHMIWGKSQCVQTGVLKGRQRIKHSRRDVLQLHGFDGLAPEEKVCVAPSRSLTLNVLLQHASVSPRAADGEVGGCGGYWHPLRYIDQWPGAERTNGES